MSFFSTRGSSVVPLCLLTFCSLEVASIHAAEPVRLSVMSYNIHHGEGVDGKVDLPRLAGVIRAVSPDLVALQEVDQKTERTGNVDQPAELGRLAGMNVIFGWNIPYQGGRYGNAILSKHPARLKRNHPLKSFYVGEQRGVMEVEVDVPGLSQPLLFFATHLDYRGGSQERPASALRINEIVLENPDRPAILMGDLNDRIGSETLGIFEKEWTRSDDQKELMTFPVDKPTRQIDFILIRPKNRWKAIETRVLEEAVASDHRAIVATLELSPDGDATKREEPK